jgi:hypothetical protein
VIDSTVASATKIKQSSGEGQYFPPQKKNIPAVMASSFRHRNKTVQQ